MGARDRGCGLDSVDRLDDEVELPSEDSGDAMVSGYCLNGNEREGEEEE
jgi:hypothetical protein